MENRLAYYNDAGNKPLPELILTKIYVAIWSHQATKC